jgi:membrane protease subunit (stomatin/prohibitin family)
MSNFSQLKDLVMGLESDFEKFYDKKNSAAGTRVRKGMQELKNLAQSIRTEVQNAKNSAAEAPAAGAAKAAPAKKAAAPAAAKKAAPAKKK